MTNITPSQLQDLETLNEGYSNHVYLDQKNLPTIGIGHNIYANGAAAINNLPGHPSYNNVLNGTQDLTDEQVQTLFENDMAAAIAIAEELFPNWDYLPSNVQAALADMAFNRGRYALSKQTDLLDDIAVMDFTRAAIDVAFSDWAEAVGVRAERDQALLTLDEQLLEQYEDIGHIIDQLIARSPDFSTPTDSSDTGTDPSTPTAPDDGIDFTPDDSPGSPGNGGTENGTETRVHLNDPEGWQVGVWYERVQPTVGPGYYVVSEDQDPTHSDAQGVFARYEGNDQWSVYGSSSQGDSPAEPPLGSHENPIIDDESIVKTPDGFEPADGFDVVQYYQDDNGFWHVAGAADPGDEPEP